MIHRPYETTQAQQRGETIERLRMALNQTNRIADELDALDGMVCDNVNVVEFLELRGRKQAALEIR